MRSGPLKTAKLSSVGPERVQEVRARAWAFVFKCWEAKKGEEHDLTKDLTPRTESGPRTTRQENT